MTEPYPDDMFEVAAQREALQNHKEAFAYLNNIEENKFRKVVPQKTKDAYNLITEFCVKEYKDKYGEFPEDEYWRYMIADYGATCEGHRVSVMITQASPYGDDYPVEGPDRYTPVKTKEYRAVREFHQKFGGWMLQGVKFLPKEEFYTTCAYYIPPVMMKLANAKCIKEFHTEVYYNFS